MNLIQKLFGVIDGVPSMQQIKQLFVDNGDGTHSQSVIDAQSIALLNDIKSNTNGLIKNDKEVPFETYICIQAFPGASVKDVIVCYIIVNTTDGTHTPGKAINFMTGLEVILPSPVTDYLTRGGGDGLTLAQLQLAFNLGAGDVDTHTLRIALANNQLVLAKQTDGTHSLEFKQYSSPVAATDYALPVNSVIHGESTSHGGTFVGWKMSPSGAGQIGGLLDVAYGAGNVDATTQRVTLSNDGVGVANLAAIAASQVFSIVTAQTISVTASSTQTAAINASTKRIVISPAGNDVWVAIGANPTASIGGAGCLYLADGSQSVPLTVSANTKVAAIASLAGGYLNVAEY